MSFLKNKKAQWISTLSLLGVFGLVAGGAFEDDGYSTVEVLNIRNPYEQGRKSYTNLKTNNCYMWGYFREGVDDYNARAAVLKGLRGIIATKKPLEMPGLIGDKADNFQLLALECRVKDTPKPAGTAPQ